MGLRINTNIASLAAQHRLQASTKRLGGALERLSSGLRINRGSDDVVGLLKSESLRTQIRGITAAELNIANATSLLGVAEGSLGQLTEIAQSIREKVVQAADASISTADRDNLTTAIADLQSEFSRIANASDFDGVKLLQGTFTSKSFQIGPNAGNTISFSISDSRASAIGKVAVLTSITIVTRVVASTTGFTDPAGITIGSTTIAASAFTTDGVSNEQASESAIAYVTAINSISGTTGVQATVLSHVVTLDYGTHAGTISSTQTIQLNGIDLAVAADLEADDTDGQTFLDLINAKSTQTGVTGTLDTTNDEIILTASDGRNIDIYVTGSTITTTGILGIQNLSASSISLYRGTFKLFADETFTLSGATAEISSTTSVGLDTTTTLDTLSVTTASNAETGLFILDNVIRQLQTRRANVGSKATRFGIAEQELQARKENLSAAESRIRDADFAKETADLTAAQILQQAGATVLSRANTIPQIALSLLQQ